MLNEKRKCQPIQTGSIVMKATITKTEIRKAINEKEINTMYRYANALNMNVRDLVWGSKVASRAKSDALWAIEMSKNENKRWLESRNSPQNDKLTNLQLRLGILAYLKQQIGKPITNYTKVAMKGFTHLYFCSPIYGHDDYNKWCTMLPLEGNEEFVEKVISISNKRLK